jgi:predicted phosphodiesterase
VQLQAPATRRGGRIRWRLVGLILLTFVAYAVLLGTLLASAPRLSTGTAGTTTIYAVGDIAGEGDGARRLAERLALRNFDALLTLGDHAYETGSLAEFENLYEPTFGAFDDRVYPAPGNHDYETEAAAGYFTYFGERARHFPDRAYYAFTLDGWRIYSLNSEIGQGAPATDMYEWLRADLGQNPAACILAYWHKPVFTVGRKEHDEGAMSMVWSLLAAHGADIVLAGHDHNYQRWEPIDGITSFVVGTGGRSRYPIEREDERLAYATDDTYGALRLELAGGGARFAYESDDGEELDSGELGCGEQLAPGDRPATPMSVSVAGTGEQVTISWQPGEGGTPAVGYTVHRGAELIGFTEATSFIDANLPSGSSFLYTVRAVDASGQRSTPSAPAHAGGELLGYTDYVWTAPDRNPSSPTADKPQSKLWHIDGTWWGILYADRPDAPAPAYYIQRFDAGTQSWTNTSVMVDDRDRSRADALWDEGEQKLYVASTAGSGAAKLYRYSYADGVFTADEGYPVRISETGSESITIAKDSTGTLWVTMTQLPDGSGPCVDGQPCTVRFMHSVERDFRWTPLQVLPFETTTIGSDDISAIVAFGGDRIGIAWSNQLEGAFVIAVHLDGQPDDAWTAETINVAPRAADDHLNLKADASGRLYMVVKSSLNDPADADPASPLVALWVREANGTWRTSTAWETRHDVTRPQLWVDEGLRRVMIVATQPSSGGAIYMKTAALADLVFESGLGTPILATGEINNPTGTKQTVSFLDGVLVLAGDGATRTYWHNLVVPPVEPPTTVP